MTYFINCYDNIFNAPARIYSSQKNTKTASSTSLSMFTQCLSESIQLAPPPLPIKTRPPRSHISIDQCSRDSASSKARPVTPRGDVSPTHSQSTTNLMEAALFWPRKWRHSGLNSPSSASSADPASCGAMASDEMSFFSPSSGKSKSKESLNTSQSNLSETESIK